MIERALMLVICRGARWVSSLLFKRKTSSSCHVVGYCKLSLMRHPQIVSQLSVLRITLELREAVNQADEHVLIAR
jgi:hypothetical protein